MITTERKVLTATATVKAPVEKVWDVWTNPRHIVNWNNASDDWYTPRAENDLRVGGKFLSRMEARDGSFGFDFEGEYSKVEPYKLIEYTMPDERKVRVTFESLGEETRVTEEFEAEETHSPEMQKEGWQAIMNNFKRYAEASGKMEVLKFETRIQAPAEKVFRIMLSGEYWNEWTTPFNPTSQFIGNWEKGSRMQFVGTDGEGAEGGMVSTIRENIPNRFLSIEHLGILKNGEEIMTGEEVDAWAGARENYFFREENGTTHLVVETDTNQEFKSYFEETWPLALEKLKEICERS